jgi:hypothetical protein
MLTLLQNCGAGATECSMFRVWDPGFLHRILQGREKGGEADHGILGVNLYEAAQADHRGHLNLERETST